MRFVARFFHSDEPTDDLYIAVLRYGREHLGEYTTPEDLFEVMKARGFESAYLSSFENFELLFWETFTALDRKVSSRDSSNWLLSLDSYFRLLEYEELHEARSSAKRATKIAIAAITIAAILAAASVGLQLWSIWGVDEVIHRHPTEQTTPSP